MDVFYEYQSALPERKREIESHLLQQHSPMIIWCAKTYFDILGRDDAKQEAMIGFLKAIRTYNPTQSSFSTWAVKIIKNHLFTSSHRWRRHQFESLEEMSEDKNKREKCQQLLTFDDQTFENIEVEDILSTLQQRLSEREYAILLLDFHNKSAQDINLGISRQRINQLKQRALEKAHRALRYLHGVEVA
jgi:RNA polymerase sigma factor (sigma-70 family)